MRIGVSRLLQKEKEGGYSRPYYGGGRDLLIWLRAKEQGDPPVETDRV